MQLDEQQSAKIAEILWRLGDQMNCDPDASVGELMAVAAKSEDPAVAEIFREAEVCLAEFVATAHAARQVMTRSDTMRRASIEARERTAKAVGIREL